MPLDDTIVDFGEHLRSIQAQCQAKRFADASVADVKTILSDCVKAAQDGYSERCCGLSPIRPQEAYCEYVCSLLRDKQLHAAPEWDEDRQRTCSDRIVVIWN